jgi:hypothetical protein
LFAAVLSLLMLLLCALFLQALLLYSAHETARIGAVAERANLTALVQEGRLLFKTLF